MVQVDEQNNVIHIQFYHTCYPHTAALITNFLNPLAPIIISHKLNYSKPRILQDGQEQ